MRNAKQPGDLKAEHRPEAVEARLDAAQSHSYLGDAVLGGIDGCVTTFAVVAGAVGAHRGRFFASMQQNEFPSWTGGVSRRDGVVD